MLNVFCSQNPHIMAFQNKFSNNLNVETLKGATFDLLSFTSSNTSWQANIKEAQSAIAKLETAQSNEQATIALSHIKKFANQIKEVRDWSAITANDQLKPLVLTIQKVLNAVQKLQNIA